MKLFLPAFWLTCLIVGVLVVLRRGDPLDKFTPGTMEHELNQLQAVVTHANNVQTNWTVRIVPRDIIAPDNTNTTPEQRAWEEYQHDPKHWAKLHPAR